MKINRCIRCGNENIVINECNNFLTDDICKMKYIECYKCDQIIDEDRDDDDKVIVLTTDEEVIAVWNRENPANPANYKMPEEQLHIWENEIIKIKNDLKELISLLEKQED